MKAQEMFEICHARYRGLRGFLHGPDGAGGHMAGVDLDAPSAGYQWRPERARAEEYVADFEMIAERALRRPEWKGRLKLFRIYFLSGNRVPPRDHACRRVCWNIRLLDG